MGPLFIVGKAPEAPKGEGASNIFPRGANGDKRPKAPGAPKLLGLGGGAKIFPPAGAGGGKAPGGFRCTSRQPGKGS